MLRTRVIPCLLLSKNKLVKTIQFKKPKYIGDPVNAVKIYNDKEVDELIFLDISASKEERDPPYDIIKEIAEECFMPFAYGGGIRNINQIRKILNLGVEKVAINTSAIENPSLIKEAATIFGSQSIIVSIDAQKKFLGTGYDVYIKGGIEKTSKKAEGWAKEVEQLGAGEILLTSIDRDGTMEGYDTKLIKNISDKVNIPLVACGGAKELKDLTKGRDAGASALAAGSIFVYQNRNRSVLINYPSKKELEHYIP